MHAGVAAVARGGPAAPLRDARMGMAPAAACAPPVCCAAHPQQRREPVHLVGARQRRPARPVAGHQVERDRLVPRRVWVGVQGRRAWRRNAPSVRALGREPSPNRGGGGATAAARRAGREHADAAAEQKKSRDRGHWLSGLGPGAVALRLMKGVSRAGRHFPSRASTNPRWLPAPGPPRSCSARRTAEGCRQGMLIQCSAGALAAPRLPWFGAELPRVHTVNTSNSIPPRPQGLR